MKICKKRSRKRLWISLAENVNNLPQFMTTTNSLTPWGYNILYMTFCVNIYELIREESRCVVHSTIQYKRVHIEQVDNGFPRKHSSMS